MVKIAKRVGNHWSGVWPISRSSSLYHCSSLCDSAICFTRNYGREEVKVIVDKRETRDLAAVKQDLKRKRADNAKELWLSPSTVSTVVWKKPVVKLNTFIFKCKTEEARGSKYIDLNAEVYSNNSVAALHKLKIRRHHERGDAPLFLTQKHSCAFLSVIHATSFQEWDWHLLPYLGQRPSVAQWPNVW